MHFRAKKSPVLIMGADGQTGYTTARALSDLGVEIIGFCADKSSRFCYSRYWNTLIHVKSDEESQLDSLFQYGKRSTHRPVLFITQDKMVQLVSIHKDELSKYYDFVYPNAEVVQLLMDKTQFHSWASNHGFPVPKSYVAESNEDLYYALDRVKYPIVIKPMFRTSNWMKNCKGNKVFMLRHKAELIKIQFDMIKAASKLIIQEWIPGPDSNVHFCLMYIDRNGYERGYYTGKKLLQWPVLRGNTSICKGIFDESLHQLAKDVLLNAGLIGLGSLEVKKSVLDHRYLITEPTVGRNNYQSYVAVAGGINLTKIAYYDAIGYSREINRAVMKKAVWIEEFTAKKSIKYLWDHKSKGDTNYRTLLKDSRCLRVTFANLNLKDLKPLLYFCKTKIRPAFKRLLSFGRLYQVFKYKINITSARGMLDKGALLYQSVRRVFIDRKSVLFYPAHPFEFHIIYKILLFLGYRITKDPKKKYDLMIKWWRAPDGKPFGPSRQDILLNLEKIPQKTRLINIDCEDISKEHLNAVFYKIFGYRISVDPRNHIGKCVMKSNWNALHKGRVIDCPTATQTKNVVYQKLIQNEVEGGLVEDMRVPIFENKTPFVYLKYRSVKDRFVDRKHTNKKAKIVEVDEVLSAEELNNIHRFCQMIGLDFGELDVLRDRNDGRIYIVDANNAPSGPPSPISEDDGKIAVIRLSKAFQDVFGV